MAAEVGGRIAAIAKAAKARIVTAGVNRLQAGKERFGTLKQVAAEKVRPKVDSIKARLGRVFRKHDVRISDGGAAIQTDPKPEAMLQELAATAEASQTQAILNPPMPEMNKAIDERIVAATRTNTDSASQGILPNMPKAQEWRAVSEQIADTAPKPTQVTRDVASSTPGQEVPTTSSEITDSNNTNFLKKTSVISRLTFGGDDKVATVRGMLSGNTDAVGTLSILTTLPEAQSALQELGLQAGATQADINEVLTKWNAIHPLGEPPPSKGLKGLLSNKPRVTDADAPKQTDTVKQKDRKDTVDTTVAKPGDKDASSDKEPDASEEAEEKSEEQILDEMLQELNRRVSRKDKEGMLDELKDLKKAAKEFASFGSKGNREVIGTIARARRLAEISNELASAQEAQQIWEIVAQAKTTQVIDALLAENTSARERALSEDPQKLEQIKLAREGLKKAKEMAEAKNVDDMTDEQRQQETDRLAATVDNLAKRKGNVRKLFDEGMKTFEKKQNSQFYKVVAKLPATLQEKPELAKQLVQLYKEGKKKKLRGIFLGTLLLLGTVVVGDLIQNGPGMLAADMPKAA